MSITRTATMPRKFSTFLSCKENNLSSREIYVRATVDVVTRVVRILKELMHGSCVGDTSSDVVTNCKCFMEHEIGADRLKDEYRAQTDGAHLHVQDFWRDLNIGFGIRFRCLSP